MAGDRHTKEQRKRNMQAIRSTGSRIETILARAMWARGYRYRKNSRTVPGKPDISIKRLKIAIFVDGEFWHGKDWETRKTWLKSNQDFWLAKIERNMRRDLEVNNHLEELGWNVLRFWGEDVINRLDWCLFHIDKAVKTAETNVKRK